MSDAFMNVFNAAEDAAKKNSVVNDNDYIGEDGLLICGNCHTPKQVRVSFLGQEKTPFCLCKCEQEKREAEDREREELEMRMRIARNREAAFPDMNNSVPDENDFRNWTFDKDNGQHPELSRAAREYVKNFEHFRRHGKGLLFYGSVGVGKSVMAACIANALLDKGYKVLMTTFARIEKETWGMKTGKQDYYDDLNRNTLLILDDLGVERNTDYMQEIVYSVIDTRSRAHLPLIVTSNLTNQELKNPEGISNQRIYSRLLDMCHPIHVCGEDQRRKKALQEFAETRKILGI